MNAQAKRYLTLFLSTFEISAFTFGGGYVIIPLMRKKFVGKLGWIDDSEMLDMTAIAQSAPGPIAVNAAILIGYKTGGVFGAILSILGAVLPPLIIISVISLFYQTFRGNKYVSLVMSGMSAGVAAVVLDVVISMTGDVIKTKRVLPTAMLVAVFILAYFFDVSVILLIIASGVVGYIDGVFTKRRNAK